MNALAPSALVNRPERLAAQLSEMAVCALLDEACLTPKPGLVDGRGSGAHSDLDLALMCRSARSLRPAFAAMAACALDQQVSAALRERLGAIGREGERTMLLTTRGVNTHRGAIWAMGLLIAAAAMAPGDRQPGAVAARAAALANVDDRQQPTALSNGRRVCQQYGVPGARGEACSGFPHVIEHGLPALRSYRQAGASEHSAQINALLTIMSRLADTCVLSRGGAPALTATQQGAAAVLAAGGFATLAGRRALQELDRQLMAHNASPGGAADLLAATLFLDHLEAMDQLLFV